ncbi:MAG: ATP-binding protein, partial [Planctomycetales bacterium]|nr:ATP-binding protein [Planctomycetales bacterium]
RSERFGLLRADVADEARFFVRTLEDGYTLQFTRSALVFDFQKAGTELPETDNGVQFHRIGIDIIQTLVDEAVPKQPDTKDTTGSGDVPADAGGPRPPGGPMEQGKGCDSDSSVPRLKEALFFVQDRDRSVSWHSLTSRNSVSEPVIEPASQSDPPISEAEEKQAGVELTENVSIENGLPALAQPEALEPSIESKDKGSTSIEAQRIAAHSEAPKPTNEDGIATIGPDYDVLLGSNDESPQYGIVGEFAGRKIALDLNETHTISLFGVQGGGKSYTLGTIAEMATVPIEKINQLPSPLATVIFHYSPTQDYRPEFTSMHHANSEEWAIEALEKRYGARPKAIEDVLLLVPKDKLKERRAEYQSLEVRPLCFSSVELQVGHWQFLMGAVGNQLYMRQLKSLMRGLRNDMSLNALRHGIDDSSMTDTLKDLARMRLDMAAQYIDDEAVLSGLIRPGRLVIVDLRDEFIEKDEALGLFVVLLQLFGDAKHDGRKFNKLVVFDEAHKYIDSTDLVSGLVEVVREMRHKGTSVMVASQDPPSVPLALIELSTQIILHRFNSPAWIKYIQKANSSLHTLTPEKMAQLRQGEAYVWSAKSTDESFSRDAMRIQCRPRVTLHGGGTKTAVEK